MFTSGGIEVTRVLGEFRVETLSLWILCIRQDSFFHFRTLRLCWKHDHRAKTYETSKNEGQENGTQISWSRPEAEVFCAKGGLCNRQNFPRSLDLDQALGACLFVGVDLSCLQAARGRNQAHPAHVLPQHALWPCTKLALEWFLDQDKILFLWGISVPHLCRWSSKGASFALPPRPEIWSANQPVWS